MSCNHLYIPPFEKHPDAFFSLQGMPVTKAMRTMSIETVFSLQAIVHLKRTFNLTDFGLSLLIQLSSEKGLSPYDLIDFLKD